MANSKKKPKALTPEEVEAENIYLTNILANKQLVDGTASSQTMQHFFKLGSSRAALERELLENQNLLLKAKIIEAESNAKMETLLKEAMEAFTRYQPPSLHIE